MNGKNPRNCIHCAFLNKMQSIDPQGNAIVGEYQLTCARRPPCVVIVSQMTPAGNQTGMISQFPPVVEGMFCFDYFPEDKPLPLDNLTGLIDGPIVSDN